MKEERSGRELTPQERHDVLYDMLCRFADYCDAHGIRYYLCGGTLLGAVRHHDLIPWDDDADVLLPRPDYERLLALEREQPLGYPYELRSLEAGTLALPYAKVLDLRTRTVYRGIVPAVWLDVFVMDGLPTSPWRSALHLLRAGLLKLMCSCAVDHNLRGRNPLRTLLKVPVCLYARLRGPGHWVARLDRLARRYDFEHHPYVGAVASSMGPCERMKKADYLPMTEVPLGGRTFHAPRCWQAYLKGLYGDYERPPAGVQRTRHYRKAVWR